MLPLDDRSLIAGCCHGGGGRHVPPPPPSTFPKRRGWQIVAGALPVAVWVLVPKCPVCVAAHVALWTGLGLSLAQASLLRSSLLGLSGGLLLYVIVLRVGRLWLPGQRPSVATNRINACCEGLARVSE